MHLQFTLPSNTNVNGQTAPLNEGPTSTYQQYWNCKSNFLQPLESEVNWNEVGELLVVLVGWPPRSRALRRSSKAQVMWEHNGSHSGTLDVGYKGTGKIKLFKAHFYLGLSPVWLSNWWLVVCPYVWYSLYILPDRQVSFVLLPKTLQETNLSMNHTLLLPLSLCSLSLPSDRLFPLSTCCSPSKLKREAAAVAVTSDYFWLP